MNNNNSPVAVKLQFVIQNQKLRIIQQTFVDFKQIFPVVFPATESCFMFMPIRKQSFLCTHTHTIHYCYFGSQSLYVHSVTLTGPCFGDSQVTQVISNVFMFWELGKFWFFDLQPVLGSALCCMAMLLLFCHVRPANPVLILRLALQMLQGVAFHLPGNLSWAPVLSDPLLPRDAFPQQGEGEKHVEKVFLEKQNRSASESLWHYLQMQKRKS